MRWELVPGFVSNLFEYRLVDDDECKAILKYNSLQHSFRIHCNDTHRVFFMQQAGFLKGKTIVTDEYGLEAGKLSLDKWYGNTCSVEIRDRKYTITHGNNNGNELLVCQKNTTQPLTSCSLETGSQHSQLLIFGLCWFLFMPAGANMLSKAS